MYECDNNIFTTAPERALLSSLDPNEKSQAEEDSCDGEFVRLYEFVDFFGVWGRTVVPGDNCVGMILRSDGKSIGRARCNSGFGPPADLVLFGPNWPPRTKSGSGFGPP